MLYSKPCMICGEDVEVGINSSDTVICNKCIAAILKMRKQMKFNSTPKTFIVRFINKDGNAVYITKSPKHITENNIKSQIKILKDEVVEQSYCFDSDVEIADIYHNKDDLQNFKGTAWGLYNSVADWVSNREPLRKTSTGADWKMAGFMDGYQVLKDAYSILQVA